MNITFSLDLFRKHIGALGIRIDIDHQPGGSQPVVDRGVKRLTHWWTEHMTS